MFRSDRIEGYFDRVHEGWQGHPVDALGGGADASAGDDDHLKHLTVQRRSFQVRFPTGFQLGAMLQKCVHP